MRRLILFVPVACLLAACAPEPVYLPAPVTPLVRQISPQEASVIVIDATNTAAAIATRGAQATATEVSARSTSTTAALQTQNSLSVETTQAALEITAQSAAAGATNVAAIRTQAAGQTATWAAPTAAAVAIAARASATAQARQDTQMLATQRQDETIAEARGWLLLAVGILFLVGMAAALVFGASDLLSAVARLKRAEADRAAAEALQQRIMQYGGFLLQLRELGAWEIMQAPQIAPPVDAAVPNPSHIREVQVREVSGVVRTMPLDEPETPERARVLHLLNQAISIAGPNASFIPSAERLGMHPQDWQLAVDKLKAGPDRPAYVQARVGRPKTGQAGGTRLCQPAYMTLGALRDGVKRGDVLPRPSEISTLVERGNIRNVTFETS